MRQKEKVQSPQMADHGRGWQGHVRPTLYLPSSKAAEQGSLSVDGVGHIEVAPCPPLSQTIIP